MSYHLNYHLSKCRWIIFHCNTNGYKFCNLKEGIGINNALSSYKSKIFHLSRFVQVNEFCRRFDPSAQGTNK